MSTITKRALAEALKKMMEKKLHFQITVTDLAEACGINRHTFIIISGIFMIWWSGFIAVRWKEPLWETILLTAGKNVFGGFLPMPGKIKNLS